MIRTLWLAAGLVSLGLGIVGVFLPLLPTVPFVLLAAFFFSKSSERLLSYLLGHRKFGPMLEQWQERRAISRRAKWAASISMAASVLIAVALGLKPLIIGLQALILVTVAIYIWTRTEV